jgi:hypothetical protein
MGFTDEERAKIALRDKSDFELAIATAGEVRRSTRTIEDRVLVFREGSLVTLFAFPSPCSFHVLS